MNSVGPVQGKGKLVLCICRVLGNSLEVIALSLELVKAQVPGGIGHA